MPANKSQHFVPRCYLRAFCADSTGAAINVFNMARERSIEAAPARGQCAKPYFYGSDGVLENALQQPEGAYAANMRRAVDDPRALSRDDLRTLHAFMLLQSYRSAAWLKGEIRMAEAQRDLLAAEATPELLEGLVITHEMAIEMALYAFRNSIDTTSHLETCILLNRTPLSFITSDDPVIYTNRFHLQKDVLGGGGLASPGCMLVMPLTPHMLLLSFDPAIYSPGGRAAEPVVIDRVSDVVAYNELQAIKGNANLYFKDWNDRVLVEAAYQAAKHRRRDMWYDVETLQETAPGSGTFVAVTEGYVHDPDRRELLHTARNIPAPADWPTTLSYTVRARRAKRGVDQSDLWD
ncbi:DUF4238 domain-containing protein [Mesorhizobium sp. SB112]|uniref:DUF4238 domain-containing protein n=1 Tax=Mesorhizobium sp. SB112 TaxID=3151853 RepID=UPI0032634A57